MIEKKKFGILEPEEGGNMKRLVLFTTAVGMALIVSACGLPDCGFGTGWGQMMNRWYGGMGMGMILLIVLVVAAVWWFARGTGTMDRGRTGGETPLDILKRRYAAGEITKEQFESMKKDLEA